MAVQFYLDIEGRRYILPINPSEITLKSQSKNEVVEVAKLGDINLFGGRSLIETSFSSFFPKDYKRPYVNPEASVHSPDEWVKIIKKSREENDIVRLIVTDCDINIPMSVESFEWTRKGDGSDVSYSIDFKEYRPHSAKYVKTVDKKVSRPAEKNKPITPGCTVICNGRLHRDSYGTGPGLTERNAKRKVNFIAKGRKCPYHVTLMDGGWRGWVTPGSVKRI